MFDLVHVERGGTEVLPGFGIEIDDREDEFRTWRRCVCVCVCVYIYICLKSVKDVFFLGVWESRWIMDRYL